MLFSFIDTKKALTTTPTKVDIVARAYKLRRCHLALSFLLKSPPYGGTVIRKTFFMTCSVADTRC